MCSDMIKPKRFSMAAIALAATLALAGCATPGGLHTTGKTIDADSLKSGQSLAGVTLSPTAWPAQDWWRSFGDPQLSALIDEALTNNPSLSEAEARARQAQAVAAGVDAARMQQVELDAEVIGARYSEKDPVYPSYPWVRLHGARRSRQGCPGIWICGAASVPRGRRRWDAVARRRSTCMRRASNCRLTSLVPMSIWPMRLPSRTWRKTNFNAHPDPSH
jgi:hypothetical protein